MKKPPGRILLATDLSARSDRAQDRAVSLSRKYKAELRVLHVIEPTRKSRTAHCTPFTAPFKPDERLIEETQHRVLAYLKDTGLPAGIRIEKGDPCRAVLRVAAEEKCDLIVTGVARNEMLGRVRLGKTVECLLHSSPLPLLIVKERAMTPYLNIAVSSDFSDLSRQVLETAAAFFPQEVLTVLHAHAAPGSWAAADLDEYRKQTRQTAYREFTDFLNSTDLEEDDRARFSVLIEWGDLSRLLRELVQIRDIDLVLVGTRTRGLLRRTLFSSTAQRIASALPCDVLVVRAHLS